MNKIVTDITAFYGATADETGVKRFADARNAKLKKKRAEGRGGSMIADHLKKGDMVDIANFAMMIWTRQHPTGKAT